VDPNINRVTIYRTLGLLKRHGLVDELDLLHVKGEGHFYERRPQRDHMHMTCLRCGKVQEFESDLFDRVKGKWSATATFIFSLRASRLAAIAPVAGSRHSPQGHRGTEKTFLTNTETRVPSASEISSAVLLVPSW